MDEIERSHKNNPHLNIQIGFNRRYSKFVTTALELLHNSQDPRKIIITVNAGEIPIDHWVQDLKIGGGRIIGEACHFLDLAQFLAQSQIITHSVSCLRLDEKNIVPDTVSINLEFHNGSLATVHYFSNGNKRFPKERIEIFSSGKTVEIENFIRLKSRGFRINRNMKSFAQDKGQVNCVKNFIETCQLEKNHYESAHEMYNVSRKIIEISNSLLSEK